VLKFKLTKEDCSLDLLRIRIIITILVITTLASGFAPSEIYSPEGWTDLTDGIQFRIFHLVDPRPINVFVTRLIRNNPDVILESSIAQGKLADGRETVRDMASRYDQAINYWDGKWGNRNRVVVAINGYYFNLGSGTPLSGQVHSGWYSKRFSDYIGDAGFAWGMDRNAFIGSCVFHSPVKQFITAIKSGQTRKIHGVNTARGTDELVIYTPQYDSRTHTDDSGVEILVEMSRPSQILPEPASAVGIVRKIRDRQGSSKIAFDQVVLSADGLSRMKILNMLSIGDEVGISQEVSDCPNASTQYWTKTYSAMGGDYHFLKSGVIRTNYDNNEAYHPNARTAIAYNSAYVFFMVVDGWNKGVSEGINIIELARFAKKTLGATDAVSHDSGGSSTMVINGQVVNNTYCNFTHNCGMRSEQQTEIQDSNSSAASNPSEHSGASESGSTFEPLVGNGMMMVVVKPRSKSDKFNNIGSMITTKSTSLRLGPGSNYASRKTLPANVEVIRYLQNYKDINGVYAKGVNWWQVDYGGSVGWVKENALKKGTFPPIRLIAENNGPTIKGAETRFTADLSSGSDPIFAWDFNDGAYGYGRVVTHSYSTVGLFQAKVNLIFRSGFIQATTDVIVIDSPQPQKYFIPMISK